MTPSKAVRVASAIPAGAKPGTKPSRSGSMLLWANAVCRSQNTDRQTKHTATFFIVLFCVGWALCGLRCDGNRRTMPSLKGKRLQHVQIPVACRSGSMCFQCDLVTKSSYQTFCGAVEMT